MYYMVCYDAFLRGGYLIEGENNRIGEMDVLLSSVCRLLGEEDGATYPATTLSNIYVSLALG